MAGLRCFALTGMLRMIPSSICPAKPRSPMAAAYWRSSMPGRTLDLFPQSSRVKTMKVPHFRLLSTKAWSRGASFLVILFWYLNIDCLVNLCQLPWCHDMPCYAALWIKFLQRHLVLRKSCTASTCELGGWAHLWDLGKLTGKFGLCTWILTSGWCNDAPSNGNQFNKTPIPMQQYSLDKWANSPRIFAVLRCIWFICMQL